MKNKFPTTTKYFTIIDNELKEIETTSSIITSLHNLINKLENIPQVTLCARGDSKKTETKHNNFFSLDNLKKIFIVGEKSRSNITKTNEDKYHHTHNQEISLDIIKNELKELINETNNEIRNKPAEHNIRGEINSEKLIENLDIDSLLKWKIFFLSFLHNSGSLKEFKSHSPFLSVTYGYKKYSISRKFALNRINHNKGIIFLYALNNGDPYYIITNLMTKELKQFGVDWYEDIHNEIMLINGMYPHYLLGIFETNSNRMSKFIINPWLYSILTENKSFDYVNGLNINQENFNQLAKELGYRNFFFTDEEGHAFISDLEERNIEKVIQPY